MSPDHNSTFSPSKLFTRPPRSRSLKLDTPVKSKQNNFLTFLSAIAFGNLGPWVSRQIHFCHVISSLSECEGCHVILDTDWIIVRDFDVMKL